MKGIYNPDQYAPFPSTTFILWYSPIKTAFPVIYVFLNTDKYMVQWSKLRSEFMVRYMPIIFNHGSPEY
jgi:hypothetical protein